jgi:hypothetical protein
MDELEISDIFDLLQRRGTATAWLDETFHDLSEIIENGDSNAEAAESALKLHANLRTAIDDTHSALSSVPPPGPDQMVELVREGVLLISQRAQELQQALDAMGRSEEQ